MIYITKNTVNTFALELTGLLSSTYIYWLFAFVPENVLEPTTLYFTSPDDSIYPCRYNQFELTEADAGATGPSNDVPILLTSGQYLYNIYGSTASININSIATLLTTDVVSTGRMVVTGDNLIINDVYL